MTLIGLNDADEIGQKPTAVLLAANERELKPLPLMTLIELIGADEIGQKPTAVLLAAN